MELHGEAEAVDIGEEANEDVTVGDMALVTGEDG